LTRDWSFFLDVSVVDDAEGLTVVARRGRYPGGFLFSCLGSED